MDAVALLERLISHRTDNPGGDERALAELLGEELRRVGADSVEVVEVPRAGAVGAYTYARFGEPRLLVNAHLDTVPPNTGWSADPFRARRVGDRLVGLGAADTKGAIAAVLAALAEGRPRGVGVLFSGDEEVSQTCMRAFVDSGRARGLERALVCEPTSLQLGVRHRGIVTLSARLRGAGGHSSRADTLPSPIGELARLAVAWDDWGRQMRSVGPEGFRGMCLNLARLSGGVAFNVVPDEATLEVSVRPPPGTPIDGVLTTLRELAARACPRAEVSAPLGNPSFHTRDPGAFAALLGASEQPAPPAQVDLGFWTEAAMLSAAGVDAVVLGPGDIAQAHAPDEWVALPQLDAACALFRRVFAATAHAI
jgi:acetylornithine deacetylase